jgi:Zn-dependent protease
MSEERNTPLWLPPRPDGDTTIDEFRAPPEPQSSPDPEPSHDPFGGDPKPWYKRAGGAVVALVILAVKFGAKLKALLLLLPKLKILTTSGTMLVSVAAYSLIWGWKFALGFVVLLFVHEMGHVIQLRREGIKASAPACIPIAEATGSDFWYALAFTGFFLNLFNLLPVVPLDGGRAMAAMAPWMWFAGLLAVLVLAFTYPNPVILLIALLAAMETWRRWRSLRKGDDSVRAYYRVPPRYRAIVALVYLGLIVALVVGMDLTHVERTLSDA